MKEMNEPDRTRRIIGRTVAGGVLIGSFGLAACGGDMDSGDSAEVDAPAGETSSLPEFFAKGVPGTLPLYENAGIAVEGPARIEEGEVLELRISASGDWASGVPTEGGEARGLARAPMGQHVHLIPDGDPYIAIYDLAEPYRLEGLEPGAHRILLFASRDWHESVKSSGAWAEHHVQVGDEIPGEAASPGVPRVAPSRPKGEYAGAEADSILVDVYVTGTTLSSDGHRVRYTLNEGTPVEMTEWAPWYFVGLPAGDHRLRVELVDGSGSLVGGEWNRHETTFTVLP